MKIHPLFIALFLLICSPVMASEWVPLIPDSPEGSLPEINVLSSTAKSTTLEIKVPGFFVDATPQGHVISVPGWSMTERVGLPALPKACALLALPANEPVLIEAIERNDLIFEGYRVAIVQEPEKDNQPKPAPVAPLPWSGQYPAVDGEPGAAGFIKELPVCSVRAFPFRLEAGTEKLIASNHMIVAVQHDFGRDSWPLITLPESTMLRCTHSVLNFGYVPRAASGQGDTQYVIITKSAMATLVQPIADWKNKSGYKTEIRTFTNHTQQAVKNIILEYPNLEYALLVGDSGDVPLAYWSGYPGDHWYACTTGGSSPDLYPDICVGRFCGNNATRLNPQFDKTLGYEKTPKLGSWLKHTVLVAHGEQYPGKYTQCKKEIATAMASSSDWTVTKCYGGETGVTNATASNLINNGVNLLNYRGHGDTQEWWSWNKLGESYYNSDVLALTNTDMHCIVLNIACYCGDISQYCMSEAWLDAEGGAVASLGATEPSYTIPNHDYDKEFYKAVFELGMTDIGTATNHACDYIINYHGYLGEANARMYLWLGDPSLKIWLDIPSTLDATFATSIPAGSQDFEVTVKDGAAPVENAYVNLFKDGEVNEIAQTDGTGKVNMRISPTTAGDLFVTVVSEDYLPFEGSASVPQGSLHFDTYKVSARFGGTVNFTLDASPANAGRDYVLLGGASGTEPGTLLPGHQATLPLNIDAFTAVVVELLNTSIFSNFAGTLDGSGQASAQLNSTALPPSSIGIWVDFAYGVSSPWNFASTPAGVKVVP
ncbi:MAG: C25 family cysteine peptidase [Planctomycetota bacterium]|jgi:hypothetical protein